MNPSLGNFAAPRPSAGGHAPVSDAHQVGMEVPAPLDLPPHLRSPAADRQRAAMHHLTAQAPWTGLDWPAFLEALMALGRTDIPLARLTEGHVDALRILAEAGTAPEPGALYGVWASRSGGTGLYGTPEDDAWWLRGRLLFASGAGLLNRALVTVWPQEDTHVLLDAEVSDWPFDTGAWHTRAMEGSRSHRVELDGPVTARRIGAENFYLDRPGFFPGGVGVAAVWTGGAARVLDLLATAIGGFRNLPVPKQLRLGRARTDLAVAVALIRQAGAVLQAETALECGPGEGTRARPEGHQESVRTVATLCRAGVGAAVRRILEEIRTLAGPAGLAFHEDLTRAVDDLTIYVAQQSQDGDAGHLGALP